jgi:hypothetical protein
MALRQQKVTASTPPTLKHTITQKTLPIDKTEERARKEKRFRTISAASTRRDENVWNCWKAVGEGERNAV